MIPNRSSFRTNLRPLAFLALLLANLSPLTAGPLQFAEHNFSITTPDDWQQAPPPAAQVLVYLKNADNSKQLLLTAVKVPEKESQVFVGDMQAGFKQSLVEQGCQVGAGQQVTINGLPFIALSSHGPPSSPVSNVAYFSGAGDQGYMLLFILKGSADAANDPEIQSIIQSFKLLSPAPPLPLSAPPRSAAYTAGYSMGYFIGRFIGYLIIPVGIIVIWLIYRARSKRKRRHRSFQRY